MYYEALGTLAIGGSLTTLGYSASRKSTIDVTDLEAELGTSYTYETVSYLVRRCQGVSITRSKIGWPAWRAWATTLS